MLDLIESDQRLRAEVAEAIKPRKAVLDLIETGRHSRAHLAEAIKPSKATMELIESERRSQALLATAAKPPSALLELVQASKPSKALLGLDPDKPPKALLDLIESEKRWREELNALTQPMRSALDLIKVSTEPLRIAPIAEWQYGLRKIVEPQLRFQQTMTSTAQLRDLLDATTTFRNKWKSATSTAIANLGEDNGGFEVTPSGEIVIGNAAVDLVSVEASLTALGADLAKMPTLSSCFRRLTGFLSRLNKSVSPVVEVLLLAILADLISDEIKPWWHQLRGSPRQEVAPKPQAMAQETYASRRLECFRFVTAKYLPVSVGDGPDERVVAELPLGKIVKLIETERRWSLVEYYDDTQQKVCRGWVANQYLSSFTE